MAFYRFVSAIAFVIRPVDGSVPASRCLRTNRIPLLDLHPNRSLHNLRSAPAFPTRPPASDPPQPTPTQIGVRLLVPAAQTPSSPRTQLYMYSGLLKIRLSPTRHSCPISSTYFLPTSLPHSHSCGTSALSATTSLLAFLHSWKTALLRWLYREHSTLCHSQQCSHESLQLCF